jgi:hypothetical protein
MRGKHRCVLQEIVGTSAMWQEVKGIRGHRTRALEDEQGERFWGREGKRCESKAMRQRLFEGRCVITGMCQCLVESVVKWGLM